MHYDLGESIPSPISAVYSFTEISLPLPLSFIGVFFSLLFFQLQKKTKFVRLIPVILFS